MEGSTAGVVIGARTTIEDNLLKCMSSIMEKENGTQFLKEQVEQVPQELQIDLMIRLHKHLGNREGSPAGVRKGSWTKVEDDLLKACVQHYGEGKWHLVPQRAGLNRCRKSCRLRWLNYLRPNIKRGDFSEDEVDLMIRLHKLLGNRWSLIAGRLPGRTSNDVKNYWNTYMRSRAQCSYSKKDKNLKPHQVIKPVPRTFSKPKPKPSSDHHSNSEVNVSSQLVAACAASSSGSTNWWETLLDDMGDDNTIALDEELVASITTNACDFLTESDQTWSDFLLNVKL